MQEIFIRDYRIPGLTSASISCDIWNLHGFWEKPKKDSMQEAME